MPVALGSNVLTGGASSKGASRSCQRCWKALLYLSDTAPLGPAHGHRKLAVGEWRGDGAFRYELPNKIPVLEANSTSQMDEVCGSLLNPGLCRRHAESTTMNYEAKFGNPYL